MIDGLLILNKPKGLTSREACMRVRDILGADKAGNSGTLDPNATGVLLICLGNATKIMPVLQGQDKEYVATIHFHQGIPDNLNDLVKTFTGDITQTPPVKSAVARKPRKRTVYSMQIMKKEDKDVVFKIRCQSGTYMRKIASDLGDLCGGAHLKELERTSVGTFRIEQSHDLSEMDNKGEFELAKSVLPMEIGVGHMKKLFLKKDSVEKARSGKPLEEMNFSNTLMGLKKGDHIALMFQEKLVALAKFDDKIFIDRVI